MFLCIHSDFGFFKDDLRAMCRFLSVVSSVIIVINVYAIDEATSTGRQKPISAACH